MKIAVVIPCYRVGNQLDTLVSNIDENIDYIFLVDDKCPDNSVKSVVSATTDKRITPIFHEVNQGVGGAVVSGVKAALATDADVIVKLDGDGQYSPDLLDLVLAPVLSGDADCAKGNRFFFIEDLLGMPAIRIIGNAILSFVNKLTSGYWGVMDPTNGLIAWRADVLSLLPLDKLDKRYFFESDMLFRLNCLRAMIVDVPLKAEYADEVSSLNVWQIIKDFPKKYVNRMFKRLGYNYFIRDFNLGSLFLLQSLSLLVAGSIYALPKWYASFFSGQLAETGEVMISAMMLSLAVMFSIAFLLFDVINQPTRTISGQYSRPRNFINSK